MANYTSRLALYMPNRNDDIEVDTSLSENFTKIDDMYDTLDTENDVRDADILNLEKFKDNSKITETEMQRITNTNRHYPVVLDTPTYDGSGEVVHPDAIYIHDGFGPELWRYWMVMTPLTGRDDQTEQPSILVSHDGVNWDVPSGAPEPLIASPGTNVDHNSDPCILHHNGQLWIWYRETMKSVTPREERIRLMTSTDGITWTAPQTVIGPDTTNALVSPTVVYRNGQFMMWLVNDYAGTLEKTTSTDGLSWSSFQSTTTTGMPSDRYYWHIHVSENPDGRLEMIYSSYNDGGTEGKIHYGYSLDDGDSWTTFPPFVDMLYPHEAQRLYRASMQTVDGNPNLYEIWYSSLGSPSNVYRVAYMNAIRINNRLYPLSPSDKKHIFNAGLSVTSVTAGSAAFQELSVGGKKFEPPVIDPWKYLASNLVNGWEEIGAMPLAYYKNSSQEVHLRGRVQNGTSTDGTVMFTLPSGYIPIASMIYRQRHADVYVESTGDVKIYNMSGSYVSMDGIVFRPT
ncbi:exo-alpha-sialidase [Halobacillus sp. H74]|uniref:exo-alpha-sialidase n=1 Tax=Halobacillus sp. H74 TaxID=3457436 RepID=UPI003FCE1B1E